VTRLRELARGAIRSLEGAARERSVRLLLDAQAEDEGHLDARLVGRALENLIANALKYSPAGAQVGVSVRQRLDGAVMEVSDAGRGIPDADKAAVFDKFHTLEAGRGEALRGFGLGLYQVKLAVDAHGGRARVRDRAGGGAIFELWFPPR
jgi:signal transduction histidine kinase